MTLFTNKTNIMMLTRLRPCIDHDMTLMLTRRIAAVREGGYETSSHKDYLRHESAHENKV